MKKFEIIGNRWIRFEFNHTYEIQTDTYDLKKLRHFNLRQRKNANGHLEAQIYLNLSQSSSRVISYSLTEEDQYLEDKRVLEEIIFKLSGINRKG
jgi:hypothetical protein